MATSGKSVFLSQLLCNRDQLSDKVPQRIVYCYREWQPEFDKPPRHIEFIEVLDDEDFFDSETLTVSVLDDQALAVCNYVPGTKLLTQSIHYQGYA